MNYVTEVRGNLQLSPPEGFHTSVLLKQVAQKDGAAGQRGESHYICWLLVGRHGIRAANAEYIHDGVDTVRIDVPDGTLMSLTFLQKQLTEFDASLPTLPPDTPIVRGVG